MDIVEEARIYLEKRLTQASSYAKVPKDKELTVEINENSTKGETSREEVEKFVQKNKSFH